MLQIGVEKNFTTFTISKAFLTNSVLRRFPDGKMMSSVALAPAAGDTSIAKRLQLALNKLVTSRGIF